MENRISKLITYYSNQITEEISKNNVFKKDEFISFIKSRLFLFKTELINNNLDSLKTERLKKRNQLNREKGYLKRDKILKELSILNEKIKKQNKEHSQHEKEIEYYKFKKFVAQRYGNDILQEFYKTLK